MPVAIRSLNGYYGFLDSLRSLEMTTVTDKSQFIEYSSYNIVGGGVLDAPTAVHRYSVCCFEKSEE